MITYSAEYFCTVFVFINACDSKLEIIVLLT